MTRNEFVTQRTAELPKRNVAAADVVEEYQQHVSFKLADGYSEEEIAARLETPWRWRHSSVRRRPVRNGTLRC
ncbi:MAG: hypothetical protein ACLR39_02470 [Oscillospiraceae bacterium]